jgi:multiple sugar transport system substrate-binding protein
MRYFARAVVVAVAACSLAACGGSGDDSKPKAEPAKTSAPAKDAAVTLPKTPEPNAEQTATLIAKLRAIKPELVVKEERAVRRSESVCLDVKQGKDAKTLASNANYRFSGGTAGQLTDAQGAKIVDAVKASFCM